MNKNNLAIAEAYYAAMSENRVADMEQYLHPDVFFVGPLAEMTGRKAVIEAAKRIAPLFEKPIAIRAKFSSDDQVMLAYDWFFAAPIGNFPAAVLMTFKNGLITKIELFFDTRPFNKK
jgi:ketosteroid isomerase-like protein